MCTGKVTYRSVGRSPDMVKNEREEWSIFPQPMPSRASAKKKMRERDKMPYPTRLPVTPVQRGFKVVARILPPYSQYLFIHG